MAANQSKYTKKNVAKLIDIIAGGYTIAQACFVVGIADRTFYDWRERYPEFAQKCEEAKEIAGATRLERISEAGRKGDWRADAWWLEHTIPERFARNRVDVKHSGSISMEHQISEDTIDDARSIVEALGIVAGENDPLLAVSTEQ